MHIDFTDPDDRQRYRERYVLGLDADVEYPMKAFIEEVLDVNLAKPQAQIIESVHENPKTAVKSGNGMGKSFTMACLGLAWMYTNDDAFGLITGGNNSQLKDGLWDDLATLQGDLSEAGFPGRVTNSNQDSQLKFEARPNHKMRCLSARNAGSLEGKHQGRSLVIIEEANKPTIDRETIRSAVSTVTDEQDRVVVIGNPPERGHPFEQILESPQYNKLHFTAFDSRNVRRELGETDRPSVDGIITPYRIKDIWQSSHPNKPWPGLQEARTLDADTTDELHEDWYRLVHGQTPPTSASAVRPFTGAQIDASIVRGVLPTDTDSPSDGAQWPVIGVDLATGVGDDTSVAVGVSDDEARVVRAVTNPTGDQNTALLREMDRRANTVVVDAIREENFLDSISTSVTRFKGSMRPADDETYENKRVQSYFEIGDWLDTGGRLAPATDDDETLIRQLREVARVTTAERRSLRSREVYQITAKSAISQAISESSPDYVDALAMACYGHQAMHTGRRVDTQLTQRDLF